MKILILANHLNIGGITRYVLNLSYGLKMRGHQVFVASLPGKGQEFLRENDIDFLKLPLRTKSILSPRLVFAYFILKGFIQRQGIELIHAQTRITQFLASWLSRRLGVAYVSTFHGFYRPHLARRLFPCPGNLTIAISRAVADKLIEQFKLNPKNLRVIYNSINPMLPRDRQVSSRQKGAGVRDYAQLKGKPTLGIVARLSAEKGHLELFRAFKRLISQYPAAKLLVVGLGKTEKQLKHWVESEGLANQIAFLGNIDQLDDLFSILDVSLLPSTLEGLGFSILEAQASGVPVVASCVGGITEIIQDRQTGILVKPADVDDLYRGIRLVLEDASLRRKLVLNAKKQIDEKFGFENMVSQVEAVYKELID